MDSALILAAAAALALLVLVVLARLCTTVRDVAERLVAVEAALTAHVAVHAGGNGRVR
jgi:hypothetical protein